MRSSPQNTSPQPLDHYSSVVHNRDMTTTETRADMNTITFDALWSSNGNGHTRDTLIRVDGKVVGSIHSYGPRGKTYRVTILLPTFKEVPIVFGYEAAKQRAAEMLAA